MQSESQKTCLTCKGVLVQGRSRMTYQSLHQSGRFGTIVSATFEWCPVCKKVMVPAHQFIGDFAMEVLAGEYKFELPPNLLT